MNIKVIVLKKIHQTYYRRRKTNKQLKKKIAHKSKKKRKGFKVSKIQSFVNMSHERMVLALLLAEAFTSLMSSCTILTSVRMFVYMVMFVGVHLENGSGRALPTNSIFK